MSIEGQGHFFTIYFPGFVCFVLYYAKISGERLQDQSSSGFIHEEVRFCFRYWYQNGCLSPDLISMFMAVDLCVKENGGLQVSLSIALSFESGFYVGSLLQISTIEIQQVLFYFVLRCNNSEL